MNVIKLSPSICDSLNKKTGIIVSLLFATLARMLLTIVTYGCKVPAGIFVPSMAAGATFGRALGIIVDLVYANHKDSFVFRNCPKDGKCIIPGTYAFWEPQLGYVALRFDSYCCHNYV